VFLFGNLLASRRWTKKKRLGEVLTKRGKISAPDLARALELQKEKSDYLGELLLQAGLVSKDDLVATLGEMSGVDYWYCSNFSPSRTPCFSSLSSSPAMRQ